MKKGMIISAVVASLLLGGLLLQASSDSKSSEESVKDVSSGVKHQKLKTSVEKEVQNQNQNFKNAPKEIMEELKLAEVALENYNTQVARKLLIPLRDDIVITTNLN